ncbi:MAG: C25 family cysteine peptidase [Anaerolineales bacterium]
MSLQDTTPRQYFFNGISPDGNYLFEEYSVEQVFKLAQGEYEKITEADQKRIRYLSTTKEKAFYGFDAPLNEISEAGWGVIAHESLSEEILHEIEKLRSHRKTHGNISDKLCPEIIKLTGIPDYRKFLAERNVSPGFGNVEKLPYYLLIVGGPEVIPFRFQYELATEYAVGRIAFKTRESYQAYIEQLIAYETAATIPTERKIAFWSPANIDDQATSISSRFLVNPLYDDLDPQINLQKELFIGDKPGREASKKNLTGLLNRKKAPALLFTASHGLGHQIIDSEEKMLLQGALVTQDWEKGKSITSDALFSGNELANGANVHGMVHLAFACFGAGTPAQDDYEKDYSSPILQPYTSQYPFISHLASQELVNGALAFIGHVDRTWAFSFIGERQLHLEGFERAIRNMLLGKRAWPIGHCLRDIYDKALHLSKSLLEDLHDMKFGRIFPPRIIADKWVERNDARAYALIGDPAVRLRVNDME